MKYPAGLQPSTTERLTLPSGRVISVPKATPVFSASAGLPMGNTFGGKPALDWAGSPVFAELIILQIFLQAGWSGRWVETYGAPAMHPRFLTEWSANGLKSTIQQPITEPRVTTLLEAIAHANGDTYAGCWDVVAWSDHSVVFAEAKRRGKDQIKPTQRRWLATALEHGVTEDACLVVEWSS